MTDFLTNRQRQRDKSGMLVFLTVEADSFTAPLEIVADTQDWTSNGVTYTGAPFGFTLPDDVAGQSPRAQLVLANPGRGISEEMERVQGREEVWATVRLADRSAPDTIWATYPMPLTNVRLSGPLVTAQAGWDHIMRGQAVRILANAETAGRPA